MGEMTMVDKVAKAIANAHYGEDCWDALTEEVFDEYLALAHAAIEAHSEHLKPILREPFGDQVYGAYNAGIERDGKWMDGAMSDAEWLRRELGLPSGWSDAEPIKAALPALVDRLIDAALNPSGESPWVK